MKKCRYNDKIVFETNEKKTKTNNANKRKNKIVWYNLTFSSSVKKNIGRNL